LLGFAKAAGILTDLMGPFLPGGFEDFTGDLGDFEDFMRDLGTFVELGLSYSISGLSPNLNFGIFRRPGVVDRGCTEFGERRGGGPGFE